MKHLLPLFMLAASVIIAGCRQTSVAGVTPSEEEQAWEDTIRRSYSGYRPPRCAAPAVIDNTSSRRSAPMSKKSSSVDLPAPEAAVAEPKAEVLPVGDTDPMVVVDNAAEVTSTDPDAQNEAPKAEAPKAEAPKAETPKAEPAKVEPQVPASEAAPKNAESKKAAVEPSEPTASTIYVVRSGDTLGAISRHFYGSARYYEVIVRANADLVKDPNTLKPGMKLIIPKL